VFGGVGENSVISTNFNYPNKIFLLCSADAAMVIDKQKVAVDILHEIRTEVSRMKESIGMVPGLAVLHVGDTKLSTPYWAACGFVGIKSEDNSSICI